LAVIDRVPLAVGQPAPGGGAPGTEEAAWKNCWNWNLCDAAYGSLVLDIKEGRGSAELKSQGFNYAYRRTATPTTQHTPTSTKPPLPPQTATSNAPNKVLTPAPAADKVTPQEIDAVSSPPQAAPSTSEPTSGKETPPIAKLNGSDSATASTPGSVEKDKSERDREKTEKFKAKKKERKERDRDRDRAERDAARDAGTEGSSGEKKDDATATTTPPKPELDTSGSPAPGSDGGPLSPRTDSTGTRTPTSRKPRRHPWTLFVRLPAPTSEAELRDFFGEAKGGITRVSLPAPLNGRERKIAYVEFGEEDAMKAGLEKNGEKMNEGVVDVMRATERDSRDYSGFRGRGGRGGPRGAFAHRSFATAGLVRGGVPKTNGNGDA